MFQTIHKAITIVVIVDGLLCSIIKALSRSASVPELIGSIESEVNETVIKTSWFRLFSHFNEVWDDARKMKVIDIKRQSNRIMLEDIIAQLKRVDDLKGL